MRIDVAFRREDAVFPGDGAVVVIDVLRATSTIVTAIAAGAASVRPVDTPEAALALREASPRPILAGERGARPIPGFDLGNSPAALLAPATAGQAIVLATTNGSRALFWAAGCAADVYALALLNVGAMAQALAHQPGLYVLCAGTEGSFALDDVYVAGALIDRLGATGQLELSDAARAALLVFAGAGPNAYPLLASSRAGQSLLAKGYRADIEFAARTDAFAVVPRLRDGVLRGSPGPVTAREAAGAP